MPTCVPPTRGLPTRGPRRRALPAQAWATRDPVILTTAISGRATHAWAIRGPAIPGWAIRDRPARPGTPMGVRLPLVRGPAHLGRVVPTTRALVRDAGMTRALGAGAATTGGPVRDAATTRVPKKGAVLVVERLRAAVPRLGLPVTRSRGSDRKGVTPAVSRSDRMHGPATSGPVRSHARRPGPPPPTTRSTGRAPRRSSNRPGRSATTPRATRARDRPPPSRPTRHRGRSRPTRPGRPRWTHDRPPRWTRPSTAARR
jgi:hypothetical protein